MVFILQIFDVQAKQHCTQIRTRKDKPIKSLGLLKWGELALLVQAPLIVQIKAQRR